MPDIHTYSAGRILAYRGDITHEAVDAIVNAANESLLGGGGVDGAIHAAGGEAILEACRLIRRTRFPGGLPVGEAVMTIGGRLPARHVIHTVGPVYGEHDGAEPQLLASCYRRAVEVAAAHHLETIAFPAISTGVFGYPQREAAAVASRALTEALKEPSSVREVRLVFFGARDLAEFVHGQRF